MRRVALCESPFLPIAIVEVDGAIARIDWGDLTAWDSAARDALTPTPLLAEAIRQLTAYFEGTLRDFDLPLAPVGTPFQRAVWDELRRIPYGQTRSYGEIARRLGNPRATRAVGMANHKNPISIVIPCHRVIGGNGQLVGYASGLDIQRGLLSLEGARFGERRRP